MRLLWFLASGQKTTRSGGAKNAISQLARYARRYQQYRKRNRICAKVAYSHHAIVEHLDQWAPNIGVPIRECRCGSVLNVKRMIKKYWAHMLKWSTTLEKQAFTLCLGTHVYSTNHRVGAFYIGILWHCIRRIQFFSASIFLITLDTWLQWTKHWWWQGISSVLCFSKYECWLRM